LRKVAIIGAGIAGLAAAHRLQQQADICIFEKSWRAGGRVSTRQKQYSFDHGAQYFCVKTGAFRQFLNPLLKQGIIRRWDARFVEFNRNKILARRQWNADTPHYVAVPGMADLGRALARDLKPCYQTRVTAITRSGNRWQLACEATILGEFDWVILAIPAPQAAALMPDCFSHYRQIQTTSMQACYSLMLGFRTPLQLDFDAALIRNTDISWISVNSNKPARSGGFALLVHSTNSWADNNLGLSRQAVTAHLVAQVEQVIQRDASAADHVDLHRWLYANIDRQKGPAALIDHTHKLAAIGDWCISGCVESAFTSGFELNIDRSGR
jgi:hypothetical protein